jgi:uncharacterized protein YggU (UPF0235/DUF167 family)
MESDRKFKMHDGNIGAAITVRITPRSKVNQIKEILKDGTIHLKLTASGEDQEINKTLVDFLAQILGVKKGDIEIIAGQNRMNKLVTILNIDADTVQTRIMKYPKL